MEMNGSELTSLLFANSARKYNVEYQGFLYNHVNHGIVALYRLAASSKRIERFIEWYTPKLEPAGAHIPVENGDKLPEPEKLLGARKSFYALYNVYEQKYSLNGGSLDRLIAEQLLVLGRGLAGSALHGIIQLGYGYSAGSEVMVIEGLAYMHCAYLAPTLSSEDSVSTGISDCNIFEVINRVHDDVSLSQLVRGEIVKPEWQSRNTSNFQRSVEILLKYSGDKLMKLARSIEVPSDVTDTTCLARWMVNNAITVYATSEQRNDFFLLHGVTAAWSLLQVITLIGDSTIERELIVYYTCALLAAYKTQGAPKLLLDSLHDNNSYGIKLRQSWDTVIQDALSTDYDEHIFKLIQVCRDMDDGNTDAELTRLYMTAASVALDNPLIFKPL